MDTKAAFDREAFAKEHGMTMELVNWFFDKKAAGCGQVWFMMAAAMWEGWKESRAAIEIERKPYCVWPDEWHSDGYIMGWNDCIDELTSHGIKVKS